MSNAVASAIKKIGLSPIARRFDLYASAVQKWRDDGCLPQTDLSGLTNYADAISEMSEGEFTPAQLLDATREAWLKRRAITKRRRRK